MAWIKESAPRMRPFFSQTIVKATKRRLQVFFRISIGILIFEILPGDEGNRLENFFRISKTLT